MYFNMSEETIFRFATAKELVRGRLKMNLILASDTLVEDFFDLVGKEGDSLLVTHANHIYASLKKDNPNRSKIKYLRMHRDYMRVAYTQRNEIIKVAA